MEKLEFRKMWADRLKHTKFYERNIKSKRWKILEETENHMLIGFDEDDDFIITYHNGIIKPVAMNINNVVNCASIFLEGQSSIEIPLEDVFISIEQFDTIEDELEMYEITVNEYPAHLDNFTIDFPVFSIETLKGYDTENNIPMHVYKLGVYPSPMELLPIPYSIFKTIEELYGNMKWIKKLYTDDNIESVLTKRGGALEYTYNDKLCTYLLNPEDQQPEIYKINVSDTEDITLDMRSVLNIVKNILATK